MSYYFPFPNYSDRRFTATNAFNYSYDSYPIPDSNHPLYDHQHTTPFQPKRPVTQSKSKPPASPSQDYLDNAHKPSVKIASPFELRKLLVLDLNGTLVYRSPHSSRRVYQDFSLNSRNETTTSEHHTHTSSSKTTFRVRPVHLRPYMRSFREYLFHPRTREWLDTMVWSSAQPHSVEDMVEKSFADRKQHLIAVWARDTLGLDEKDYHRKAQTTKDLTKPWSWYELSNTDAANTNRQAHSARTTLLLDDSPRKAHLQPFNHLCIREYDATLRNADLLALSLERVRDRNNRMYPSKKPSHNQSSSTSFSSSSYASSTSSGSDIPGLIISTRRKLQEALRESSSALSQSSSPKKRKRRSQKKKLALARDDNQPIDVEPHTTVQMSEGSQNNGDNDDILRKGYDTTLLAVVGVLERIKWESNVAGWIRAAGLTDPVTSVGAGGSNEEGETTTGTSQKKKLPQTDENLANKGTGDLQSHERAASGGSSRSGPLEAHSSAVGEDDNTLGDSGQWQWFHDGAATTYWATEGLRALKVLGVEIDPGVF